MGVDAADLNALRGFQANPDTAPDRLTMVGAVQTMVRDVGGQKLFPRWPPIVSPVPFPPPSEPPDGIRQIQPDSSGDLDARGAGLYGC